MPAPRDAALVALAQAWRRADPDPGTAAQLGRLLDAHDLTGLAQMFGGRLGFGTAGLRARVGPGPLQMNSLVVRQTAFGLARYLRRARPEGGEVVVGFDGRTDSARFADDLTGVLAAAGLQTVGFDRPVPTPQVGFAVRCRRAALGVVITASHNPPAYNGIKIFWGDGVQLVPPHDQGVAQAIAQGASEHLAPPWLAAAQRPAAAAAASDVAGELEAAYLAAIAPRREPDHEQAHPGVGQEVGGQGAMARRSGGGRGEAAAGGGASGPQSRDGSREASRAAFGVAYSPLHGVGLPWVARGLAGLGFTGLHTVAAQAQPDGSFPTLPAPNPEEPEAMRAVIALAQQCRAQLALATDPDADRLAVAAPTPEGWRQLTGDEIGALFGDFLLPRARRPAVLASTLVSSPLLARMAERAGATHFCTPTGFRWLAQGMRRAQANGLAPCLAYEEALGFCLGDVVWDKDGVAALLALVEMAHFWWRRGQSLWDRLGDIAARFGLCVSSQRTVSGAAAAAFTGDRLRACPPARIAGRRVTQVRDLMTAPWSAPEIGAAYPASDVLIYSLEGHSGGSEDATGEPHPAAAAADAGGRAPGARGTQDTEVRVVVRPSGTEPKVKCYYMLTAPAPRPGSFLRADRDARGRLQELADCHIRDTSLGAKKSSA